MKATLEKLRLSKSQLNNATVALREAGFEANNVIADCIAHLSAIRSDQ